MPAPTTTTNPKSETTLSAVSQANVFVAPVYGAITASGTIDQVTLQQVTVSMDYEDAYEIALDASASKTLLESFDVSGGGNTFSVKWATGAKDNFKAVMGEVIRKAVAPATGAGGATAGKTLEGDIDAGLLTTFQTVYSNLLPNALENNWTVTSTVDASGGATSMYEKLRDAAGALELIAQQIPEANWGLYIDANENGVRALPLKGNDKLAFIFEVTMAAVNSGTTKTEGSTADAAVGGGAAAGGANAGSAAAQVSGYAPYGGSVQNKIYTYTTRKVAFFVQVKNAAGNAEKLILA
jgi:hypothetical protein